MSPTPQTPSSVLAHDRDGPAGETTIVLVHAGVADRRMWDPLWEDLTAAHDAVRVDLHGFGESDTRPPGAVDHVADVVGVLDALDISECHLVGASFGAGVAVEVGLTWPDRVRSLLLAPPGGSLLAELTPALQAFIETEESALERDDLDAAVEANVDTWAVGPGRRPEDVDAGVLDAVRVMQRRTFEIAGQWGEVDEVELTPPALDRLAELTAPVLLLLGGHDLDTTLDAAGRVTGGVPHARRVDWPDVAHLPSMEKPGEFLMLLLDWIDQADTPGSGVQDPNSRYSPPKV